MRARWISLVLSASTVLGCAPGSTGERVAAPVMRDAGSVSITRGAPTAGSQVRGFVSKASTFDDGRARAGDVTASAGLVAEGEASMASIVLPKGITCSIQGGGSPFPERCDPPSISAFGGRRGGRAIASFTYQGLDVVWGFFEGGGRAFVDAESNGVRMRAYTDASGVLFQLTRDVEILAGHVWLNEGAPVHVGGGVEGGVHVNVDGDVRGVDEVFAPVECRDVRFDLAPQPTFVRSTPSRRSSGKFMFTKHDTLRLLTAPKGLPITTLRNSDDKPIPRSLEVLDATDRFTRVAFETTHARFDAWVSNTQITDQGGGMGFSGGSGCGRSSDFMSSRRPRVLSDTHVRVGAFPVGEEEESLTIVAETEVVVQERRGGFAAVFVRSEIGPPEGQHFWIPEEILSK